MQSLQRIFLIRIPENVGFAQAAVTTNTIVAAYYAVLSEDGTEDLLTIAIVDLADLGLNRVAVTAQCGARHYGVDIDPAKFDQAQATSARECKISLGSF